MLCSALVRTVMPAGAQNLATRGRASTSVRTRRVGATLAAPHKDCSRFGPTTRSIESRSVANALAKGWGGEVLPRSMRLSGRPPPGSIFRTSWCPPGGPGLGGVSFRSGCASIPSFGVFFCCKLPESLGCASAFIGAFWQFGAACGVRTPCLHLCNGIPHLWLCRTRHHGACTQGRTRRRPA